MNAKEGENQPVMHKEHHLQWKLYSTGEIVHISQISQGMIDVLVTVFFIAVCVQMYDYKCIKIVILQVFFNTVSNN